MPEGDTIFRAARVLHRALAGRTVTRFESPLPSLARVDQDAPIAGRTIEAVTSRGKHLLMSFSGGLVLHTHMRMNGSWHVYRRGERWQRPRRDLRVLVETEEFVAIGFNVPVAEFLDARALARHPDLGRLGPDLLDPALDRADAAARLGARGSDAIADALLDQRAVAGIGNVLKSEILFVARVHPFARVASLGAGDLTRLVDAAVRLLRANTSDRDTRMGAPVGRRTTGSLDPAARLWVYGRGGKPCRVCGARVQAKKTGTDARITYWCPVCQPPSG